MSQVGVFDLQRLTNVSRFRFEPSTSTDESNDAGLTLWRVSEWLCGLGMSAVSLFIFSHRFVTHILDLHLYRSDLDLTALTAGSNDPVQVF